ncbi:thiamine pyrophosphate-dependent enzyme [Saccharopolyspora mangrovi]|uniref:Thiamine pyrophosphate-binding protein n=1 Tax=Saccharopolyspora mangrovi TaxID=3082379 RepID=A0ABU6A5P0_9PSEU|nr:thiamine pyrophosphate-dependent enzyme [Saccharopolyspora sp. S2-29]MEB3366801.1 thiamine pyrophosphate-binding protein [Saccharopolyspora sp. S2-29]
MRTVAQAVARVLADAGVEHGFTVPGESFLGLLDAFSESPELTLVSTRHESGAAFMAEACGKLRGVPAVAMASRGPGATNLSIGVHTARQDHTPMVVLLGQVPSTKLGRESFQEVDLAAMYAHLANWSAQPSTAAEVPGLVAEALAQATGPRPGPAVVAVPSDFWDEPFPGPLPVPEAVPAEAPDVAGAAERLGAARSPVMIAGARDPESHRELVATAEALGLAVYTGFRRQDSFPEDHPQFAGHLGLSVPDAQLKALENADVVLTVGMRLDEVTSQGFRFPLVEQEHLQLPPSALAELRAKAPARQRDWSAAHAAAREFMTPPDFAPGSALHPTEVVRALRELAPRDAVVTNDAGNFSGFAHRYWGFTEPRTQLGPCNGAMGYAVPSAVAAKLVAPERAVLAMVGDGGALMTGQEIETAVRHAAPIVVVVFQNGLYGTIALHQVKSSRSMSAVDIGAVDFAAWARSLGAAGHTVDTREQLEPAIRAALAEDRPCVLDVRTDPDVLTADARLGDFLES